ncbi:MAG: hypothetical protein JWP32_38, partial [Schumannella sp.]|nr:hypothetical protein [Schumannella sp.]
MDGTRRPLFSVRGASAIAITMGLVAFGSLAGAESAAADPVPPGSALDQQNTVGDDCSTNQTFGQSFVAGFDGDLTAVGLDIRGNFSGATDVRIEATTGGLPNGTVLATGTYTGAFIGVVALSTPTPVVAGTTYALILSGNLEFGCGTNSYPGGMLLYSFRGPWAADYGTDLVFSTYVIPAGAPHASDVSASTPEGVAVGIPLAETGGVTDRIVQTAPAHGAVTFTGSTATFTPTGQFAGTDSFTYIASNVAGNSALATVTVTVVPPVVVLSASSVVDGDPLTVDGSGFPANLWVDIRIGPSSLALTTVMTSATGTFHSTVIVTAGTPAGAHTIFVTGQGVTSTSLALTVTAAAVPPPVRQPIAGVATLPATGSDGGGMLATGLSALALLGVGS